MRKFLAMAAVGSRAMTGAQADVGEEDLANDAANTSGGLPAGSDPFFAPGGAVAGFKASIVRNREAHEHVYRG